MKSSEIVPGAVYAHKTLRPDGGRAMAGALGLVRVTAAGLTEAEAERIATGVEPDKQRFHRLDSRKAYAAVVPVEPVRDRWGYRETDFNVRPRAVAVRDLIRTEAEERDVRETAAARDAALTKAEADAAEAGALASAALGGLPVHAHGDLDYEDRPRIRLTLDGDNRGALAKAAAVRETLRDLLDAAELQGQGFPASGMETPDNPFGQMTATLPDGRKVHRWNFLREKVAAAKAVCS